MKLSKRALRIKREYLETDICLGEYDVGFSVGVQGFNIRTHSENKKSAEWMKRMLANALDEFLKKEGLP